MVAPRRPEIMPNGRPKLRPQPECTMGTIASTRTAFQLKRLIVLVICVGRSAPTIGARIKSAKRNPAMISLGRPKLSINSLIFVFFPGFIVLSCIFPMLSPPLFNLADHEHTEFF